MKQRSLLIFCLILSVAGIAAAQTVTNMDLDKYREQRLQGERDYQNNYERMGFPSPAELEKQRVTSIAETEKLSAKLRAERLEQERLDRQAELVRATQAAAQQQIVLNNGYQDYGYAYGGYGYGSGYYRRRHRFVYAQPLGYYAGGQFWPPPVGTHVPPPRAATTFLPMGGGRRGR